MGTVSLSSLQRSKVGPSCIGQGQAAFLELPERRTNRSPPLQSPPWQVKAAVLSFIKELFGSGVENCSAWGMVAYIFREFSWATSRLVRGELGILDCVLCPLYIDCSIGLRRGCGGPRTAALAPLVHSYSLLLLLLHPGASHPVFPGQEMSVTPLKNTVPCISFGVIERELAPCSTSWA